MTRARVCEGLDLTSIRQELRSCPMSPFGCQATDTMVQGAGVFPGTTRWEKERLETWCQLQGEPGSWNVILSEFDNWIEYLVGDTEAKSRGPHFYPDCLGMSTSYPLFNPNLSSGLREEVGGEAVSGFPSLTVSTTCLYNWTTKDERWSQLVERPGSASDANNPAVIA